MSTTTENMGLKLTNGSEGEVNVIDWINGLTGHDQVSESNMEIIDREFGTVKNSTDTHIANLQVHVSSTDKSTWNAKANLIRGYYDGTNFYEESNLSTIISPVDSAIYSDQASDNTLYVWDSTVSKYVPVSSLNSDMNFGTWG